MATIRQRGARYRADVKLGGVRDSRTFPTKSEARAWAAARERELTAGVRGSTRHTLQAALERYAREVSPTHRGARWERVRIAKMVREFPGVNRPLRDLTAEDVSRWRDDRLRAVTARGTPIASASVAREHQLLRAVLAHARREWGYLTVDKLAELKGPRKPPAGRPRTRRPTDDEVERIVAALGYVDRHPIRTKRQRVAIAFLLALETGMRCGELCGLTWARAHLGRRFVHLTSTKNGDARDVPLSPMAAGLLWLLPFEGVDAPVLGVSASVVDVYFRAARDRCEIADLHFHDARAEAATRLARRLNVVELTRVLGHRDTKSVMVYFRASAEDIAARL